MPFAPPGTLQFYTKSAAFWMLKRAHEETVIKARRFSTFL